MRQPCSSDQTADALDDICTAKAEVPRDVRFLDHADTHGLSVDQSAISHHRL